MFEKIIKLQYQTSTRSGEAKERRNGGAEEQWSGGAEEAEE